MAVMVSPTRRQGIRNSAHRLRNKFPLLNLNKIIIIALNWPIFGTTATAITRKGHKKRTKSAEKALTKEGKTHRPITARRMVSNSCHAGFFSGISSLDPWQTFPPGGKLLSRAQRWDAGKFSAVTIVVCVIVFVYVLHTRQVWCISLLASTVAKISRDPSRPGKFKTGSWETGIEAVPILWPPSRGKFEKYVLGTITSNFYLFFVVSLSTLPPGTC